MKDLTLIPLLIAITIVSIIAGLFAYSPPKYDIINSVKNQETIMKSLNRL